MRIQTDTKLPTQTDITVEWLEALRRQLVTSFRDIATQLNGVTEGGISAITNASTAAPTTGTWAQGDFIRNSTPSEAGGAGSKYIITGFVCTASGTPGTWVQTRSLTGN